MEKLNIERTKDLDLCCSCGICVAVCNENAITLNYSMGQFIPEVNNDKCIMCGNCLDTCPGIDIIPPLFRHDRIDKYPLFGRYYDCYTAYSKNYEIRKNSTSGGLITNLVINLINDKKFDAAFVLDYEKFDGTIASLILTNNIEKIIKSSKSKYIAASVFNVIKEIKENKDKKYIIIGTPCQIYGIRKFLEKFNINDSPLLFLGLFCDCTLNYNIYKYYEKTYGRTEEKIAKFLFRSKDLDGWPGHTEIYFNSGRKLIINRNLRIRLKKYFKLTRCLFCFDKLNNFSDISFGDCYIKSKEDPKGKSSVIVRTKKGKEILYNYSYLFKLEKVSKEEILKSQLIFKKIESMTYSKIFCKENNLYSNYYLNYEINLKFKKKLLKMQKFIKLGKNFEYSKINSGLSTMKLTDLLNYFLSFKRIKNLKRLKTLLFSRF